MIYNENFFYCNYLFVNNKCDLIITSPAGYRQFGNTSLYKAFLNDVVNSIIDISNDNCVIVYCLTDEFDFENNLINKQYIVSDMFYKNGYTVFNKLIWYKYPHRKNKGFKYATFLFIKKNDSDIINNDVVLDDCFEYNTSNIDEFPSSLIKKIILKHSNKNDIVCDPFMGTGNVILESKRCDRQYIGIEMNTDVFKTAQQKLL